MRNVARIRWLAIAGLALLLACGGTDPGGPASTTTADAFAADTAAGDAPDGDPGAADVAPDSAQDGAPAGAPDGAADSEADTATLPDLSSQDATLPPDSADAGTGACSEAGCPCDSNAQCNSGLCIEIDEGKQCATPCVSGCPEGFKCSQVSGSGGDIASVCTPATPRICEPCKTDSDCNNVLGGSGNRCVPYVDGGGALVGSFCGAPCSASSPCATGYKCADVKSIDGVQSSQCVREDLLCPCDKRAVKLGLGTTCSSVNPIGSCGGKRSCSANGLSACSAPAASAEACNLVDDDCDGQTDEPSSGMCDDGTVCTYDNCIGGACQHPPNAVDCDDGTACTSGDTCVGIKCTGTVLDCDDKNPCTTDSCDAKSGCVHVNNTLPCTDDDVCTLIDVCAAGACVPGKAVSCNDGNPCTDDTCDKVNACEHLTKPLVCTDGNACTEGDACVDGFCAPGPQLDCDDKNPCTTDTCDAKTGCKHVAGSQACDDGSVCTLGDACAGGVCVPGKAVSCDDGNPCTDDTCDIVAGCGHQTNTLPCSDNNSCTLGDTCKNGACVPVQFSPCDDKNPCTTETCDPVTGCDIAVNTAPCSDDSVCTTGDTCAGGLCVPGGLVDCDDKNPCTNDSCDSVSGCIHAANGATCDDGNTCTFGDACKAGVCVGGPVQNCDDGNACTNDACDAALGCAYTPNTAPCSDNSVCTTADQCAGGVCVAGSIVSCYDGNPCTDDVCDAAKGCTFVNNTSPCNDFNGCSGGDVCADGQCGGTTGCSADALCVPGAKSVSCKCNAGYEGDGFTCTDVNECAVNNGGCDPNALCTNTPGSLTCACKAGFTGDGKTCADVNECAANNGGCDANATCANTPGSFTCSCKAGFAGDGKTCADINECLVANGGCDANATCSNTAGSFSCACNAGYTGDGKTCKKISCLYMGQKYGNGGCAGNCQSTGWSCPTGYRMPNQNEWAIVSLCSQASNDYYHGTAYAVGGCNCKWNGGWCGQPSIETFDQGRLCGDYWAHHVCVSQ